MNLYAMTRIMEKMNFKIYFKVFLKKRKKFHGLNIRNITGINYFWRKNLLHFPRTMETPFVTSFLGMQKRIREVVFPQKWDAASARWM